MSLDPVAHRAPGSGGQRPRMRPKIPRLPARSACVSQVHRRDAGTEFITLATCDPQPPHVVFLQVEQVTG
ncbi:hypothetical protein ATM97_22065 [Nocardia sp. MH4]|nr:hypothetical protein [Nocardia sp. MH4]